MTTASDLIRDFLANNNLFDGFSKHQLEQIVALADIVTYNVDDLIVQENDLSNEIYIIKDGAVVVEKLDQESLCFLQITKLGPGATIGEVAMLDNAPRSATIRAIEPTTVIIIPIIKLRALFEGPATNAKVIARLTQLVNEVQNLVAESSLYPTLVQNLAKGLSTRLRETNDRVIEGLRRELTHSKARVIMGQLIISVIVILSVYIVVLKLLEELHYPYFNSTVVSAPLIAFFGVIVYWEMAKTGLPLRFYGLTFKNWRPAVKESLLCTVLMLALMVMFKWFLIKTTSTYANSPIFDLVILDNKMPLWQTLGTIGIYILLVPLQELIVRGALQTSFQELLISKHKYVLAIVLSNLLFSIMHFHISLILGLSVFIPGLFWGWLYARHKTLVGVSISHQIFGVWALMFIGL